MKLSSLLLSICLSMAVQITVAQEQSTYTFKKPSANGTGKVYMGREIAHVMSFEGVEWLERNSRIQEENTNLA
ncbi:MAG: SAM-dependent methyltransferase, partial [Flavitalea sp.]